MGKHVVILFILLSTLHSPCKSQINFKLQTGISYIEHNSLGITLNFYGKRNLSLMYGSNFFIKPKDFSSYMLQYDRLFNRLKFFGITPKIGLKGGYSVYTDEYYKWRLIAFVPFIGFNYRINKLLEAFIDFGITYSREESQERVKYGEVGGYKTYLPEAKIGLYLNLNK